MFSRVVWSKCKPEVEKEEVGVFSFTSRHKEKDKEFTLRVTSHIIYSNLKQSNEICVIAGI